ncbi:putative sulfate transporter [Ascobolus immersus RN42]|uniref:Putative sulfate transporter n=1 Tax=Ascobolus immersus RN42 TaxID=1160509 RepID=A0A3N4IPF8_ASCIM|nr:putative sulfate transporter [Ascobolus immersus RN42]
MTASNQPPRTASQHEPDAQTSLLAGQRNPTQHGTFSSSSPRAAAARRHTGLDDGLASSEIAVKGRSLTELVDNKKGWDYWSYYVPSVRWMAEYKRSYLVGDIVAGITMASIYIPMALSLSANLARLPPIHGLYGFAIQPLVYAFLGSCPTMAVGPEAAGSLLLGSAIRLSNAHHRDEPDDGLQDVRNGYLAGAITAMCGIIALGAGVVRLGFLDGVLSRSFLRGFISAVGWVIVVDQLVPELGLQQLAKRDKISDFSSVDKIGWLFKNFRNTHMLTFYVALVSFSIIMVGRVVKRKMEKRFPSIVFLPDRLLVVVGSAILTKHFGWDKQGLTILGTVDSGNVSFHWPFRQSQIKLLQENMSTSFLISILGFFESVVAAKAMGSMADSSVSSNRDLVALGTANIIGGCFQSLPGFGGYGRSKLNYATGGRTPVSNLVLSLSTILVITTLLPYFYYLPRAVLSSMISVVAVSLLEEAPGDILFFFRIRGFMELFTIALIFVTTAFWSLELGIAIGVGFSLVQVLRLTNTPRIQILGRVPGTDEPQFKSAEHEGVEVDQLNGRLFVRIYESLTFVNTGKLKDRLRRLEWYLSPKAHPGMPRLTEDGWLKWLVIDGVGVEELDGSGAQVLREVVGEYVKRGVGVWFVRFQGPVRERMTNAGLAELVGGEDHFCRSLEEAEKQVDRVEREREGRVV